MFASTSSQHTMSAQFCSRLLSRAKMMQDGASNGITCDGVCAQLCPSVLLPAEVTGASVADAHNADVNGLASMLCGIDARAMILSSDFSASSARSILCQNYCGRRMQAPYGAFFVANYLYASNYFGGFYYAEEYIS